MAQGDVFDLVQQFDKMRQGLGTGGGGIGRPPASPTMAAAAQGNKVYGKAQHQGHAGHEARGGSVRAPGDLVSWGGKQFDRSIIPFLDQIQSRFGGLRVGSGYRDPQHNARVNGVKNSYHLTGRAVDFSGTAREMQEAAAYAKTLGGQPLIHNAGSGQHLHIEWE